MKYVNIVNDTLIISVAKDYKFNICKAVNSEIQTAYQNGCTKVIVDFKETRMIDSSALRQLMMVRSHVRPENFAARNASGMVLTVLRAENLDSWLKA